MSALRWKPVVLAAVIGMSGCGGETVVDPAPTAVDFGAADELGPYAIGVTTLEISDGDSADRTLPVEIWYPAAPAADAETEQYELKLGELVVATLQSPSGAVRDAPVRGGPHPVVVFSHGNGGTRLQSYYLTEHLASHGFIVAAPDHVGNTFRAMIDNSVALPILEVTRLRPIDVSRALDAVLADDGLLAGKVDEEHVGVAGHSFGGYTTFRIAGASIDVAAYEELCISGEGGIFCEGYTEGYEFPAVQRDDRFSAALPQAPGGAAIIEQGFADVEIPIMVQGGNADRTTPHEEESVAPYDAISSPKELVIVDHAGHFTFSNMCELIDLIGSVDLFGDVFQDGCGDQNIPPPQAHRLINGYATAFFHYQLRGLEGFDEWLTEDAPLPSGIADVRVDGL